MTHPNTKPPSLSDAQLALVMAAARGLPVEKRELLLERLSALLETRSTGSQPTDGDLAVALELALAGLPGTHGGPDAGVFLAICPAPRSGGPLARPLRGPGPGRPYPSGRILETPGEANFGPPAAFPPWSGMPSNLPNVFPSLFFWEDLAAKI